MALGQTARLLAASDIGNARTQLKDGLYSDAGKSLLKAMGKVILVSVAVYGTWTGYSLARQEMSST